MFTYKEGLDYIDWHQLYQLYDNVGLVAGYGNKKDHDKIRSAFRQSYKVVTVWNNGNLIGSASANQDSQLIPNKSPHTAEDAPSILTTTYS